MLVAMIVTKFRPVINIIVERGIAKTGGLGRQTRRCQVDTRSV